RGRMAIGAEATRVRKANVAAHRGGDANRNAIRFQEWALLDMELEKGRDEIGIEQGSDGLACPRVSQVLDVMPQRFSAVGSDEIAELIQGRQSEHEPASQIRRAEPGTLL